MGKTRSPLLMGLSNVIRNIWSDVLEFGIVRPPLIMGIRNALCNIWSDTLEFGWVRHTPSNGNEKRRYKHLEWCTGIWLG